MHCETHRSVPDIGDAEAPTRVMSRRDRSSMLGRMPEDSGEVRGESMDADRRSSVHRIADEIRDIPHGEREPRLRELTNDALVRDAVRDMFEKLDSQDGESETLVTPDPSVIPAQVGRYRILRMLGEGGFGMVFLAEQTEPVRRRVALKIIKPGMDSRAVISRFEAERQALALMDHPNVARVLDAGTTERGLPFFVMEYVQGEPVTTYCDRHQLPISNRLSLFIDICDAIHHAHQKAIIHRDIKPSNILVAISEFEKPIAKVIDFGVAKALSQPLSSATLVTGAGQLIGTPGYMSPEQADSAGVLDIDTRSDVYSLGVLLYELLVGVRPFDFEGMSLDAVRETLRHSDPPRPAIRLGEMDAAELSKLARCRATDVATFRRQLLSELLWIPHYAMRRDRTQRYRSASELADDVRDFLAGQPLRAGPESVRYRMQKFVARHRRSVIMTAAASILLVAALVTITSQWLEAERLRREMRDMGMKLISTIPTLLQSPLEGRQDITELALEFHMMDDKPDFELSNAFVSLGRTYASSRGGSTGDIDQALALQVQALEIRRRLHNKEPDNSRYALGVADSEVNVADLKEKLDEYELASELYGSAIRRLEQLLESRNELDEGRTRIALRRLAGARTSLGHLRLLRGEYEDALELYEQAQSARRTLDREGPTIEVVDPTRLLNEGAGYLSLAHACLELRRDQDALAHARDAIRRRRTAYESSMERRPEYAGEYRYTQGLARALLVGSEVAAANNLTTIAMEHAAEALTLAERAAVNTRDSRAHRLLVDCLCEQARGSMRTESPTTLQLRQALEAAKRADDEAQILLDRQPENPEFLAVRHRTSMVRARTEIAAGEIRSDDALDRACRYFEERHALLPEYVSVKRQLAECLWLAGDLALSGDPVKAGERYQASLELYEEIQPSLGRVPESVISELRGRIAALDEQQR